MSSNNLEVLPFAIEFIGIFICFGKFFDKRSFNNSGGSWLIVIISGYGWT